MFILLWEDDGSDEDYQNGSQHQPKSGEQSQVSKTSSFFLFPIKATPQGSLVSPPVPPVLHFDIFTYLYADLIHSFG